MTVTGLFVGLATLDVIQQVRRLPSADEKVTALQTWVAAGGPAAVAAIAFAALGGRARLWTCLGTAPAARLAASDLAEAGVEVIDAAPPGFDLAVSTAFVDATDGRRAVVSGSGRLPVLTEPAGPDLTGVDVVLVDGHHPSLARTAVRAAAWSSVPVVVDAGSHKPVFAEVFGLASDVICSADYVHPAGIGPWDLLGLGPELVAVSHGAGDLEWRSAGAAGRIPPPVVEAVDTLGAGDVLHGGFSFALASGLDRPHALEFGVRVASTRVQHLGPFAWRAALR